MCRLGGRQESTARWASRCPMLGLNPTPEITARLQGPKVKQEHWEPKVKQGQWAQTSTVPEHWTDPGECR